MKSLLFIFIDLTYNYLLTKYILCALVQPFLNENSSIILLIIDLSTLILRIENVYSNQIVIYLQEKLFTDG